jgi:hypothetical protein
MKASEWLARTTRFLDIGTISMIVVKRASLSTPMSHGAPQRICLKQVWNFVDERRSRVL